MNTNNSKLFAYCLILSSLFLMLSSLSHAEIYECSDKEGNVTHHSTTPCPEGYTQKLIKYENKYKTKQHGYTSQDQTFKGENVEVISRGRLVDLIDHLVYGKYTVFLFYADWCAPCKPVKSELEQKAGRLGTFSLKELDVLTWDNPLVRYYNLAGLPYFIVYGPGGEFVERGPVLSKDLMSKITKAD